ncbi:CTB family bacteriocin [Sphaerospermopsis aphanizomenoides BCCUSP55]|nr:CTB family bacteriocin [Sphaerospermopsis aphanizomenoides BCCUSP55]
MQICKSEFLVDLSDQEQELLSGGQGFDSTSSNFNQKTTNVEGTSSNQPSGNTTSNSNVKTQETSNSAQDFFSLDLANPFSVTDLGNINISSLFS